MMFDEITASSLVKVDLDGNIVMATSYQINPAGFTIHSAVHAGARGRLCVYICTRLWHPVFCAAGWTPSNFTASAVALSSLAYHDYEDSL